MGKQKKFAKLKPRAPKGLLDTEAHELRALEAMLAGCPVIAINPNSACASRSWPARSAYGPSGP